MKKIILLFCILIMMSVPVFAEDVSAVLEQPAVSKALAGDKLEYSLIVKMPQDGTQYKSFAVTLLMDEKLSVKNVELKGVNKNENIVLKNTDIQNKQSIVSLSVNDVKALDGASSFSVLISTEVKKDAESGEFNNSIVLSSIKADGKETSTQKNLTSNTTVTTINDLVVNPVNTQDEIITGKTTSKAKLGVFSGDIEFANASADANGEFEIKIPKQNLGTKLKVISIYTVDGKTKTDSEEIVVSDSEGKKANVAIDTQVLVDYVQMASDIFTSGATQENRARIEAAIANGKYVLVMSDRKNSDIEDAINKIKSAVGYLRPSVMEGYWDKTFKPKKEMTRAEVAQVLSRIYLKSNPTGNYSSFKDIDQSAWYADAIGFMEEKGFMKGYQDGTFKPEKSITRAEFASVISNFYPGFTNNESFSYEDVSSKHWAKDSINYVSSKGYMTGRSSTYFAAEYPITRAECAKVINKLLNRTPNKEFMDVYSKNPFTDFDKSDWAYYEILEITGN